MITQVKHGLLSRRWILAWLVLLGFMFLAAWTVRDARYRAQSRLITRNLTLYAETGDMTDPLSPGTPWSFNRYLWDYQGPMVWLIEHGYRDPAMLRVMLLCEARRTVDETYLYTRCYNWDLREHLIEECTRAYPEDPLVAWACGRCYLAAGEYEKAADSLTTALDQGIDFNMAEIHREHLVWRIVTALVMDGHVDDAVDYAERIADNEDCSIAVIGIHAELLCLLERYHEAIIAADAKLRLYSVNIDLQDVLFRSQWWSGNFNYAYIQSWNLPEGNPRTLKIEAHDWRKTYAANKLEIEPPKTVKGEIPYYDAISEWAAITGDYTDVTAMVDEISRFDTTMSSYPSMQPIDREWFDRAEQAVLRAYVLTHQWNKLHTALAKTDEPGWGDPHSAYQTAVLLDSIAQTGFPPTIKSYWDYQELVEGGTLPWLLCSSHFAAAAEYAGRDVDEVRAEVIATLAPVREEYHDYTNGTLDW